MGGMSSMLEVSRAVNPDGEHIVGDVRSLRLPRQFDVVEGNKRQTR